MVGIEDAQIYRDLMRLRPEGMSPNAWAVKAGVSRTVWSDMRRHGNPSRRTLEKLLIVAGSSLAEFEALRVGGYASSPAPGSADSVGEHGRRDWRGAPLPPLRLVSSTIGGEWGPQSIEMMEVRFDEGIGSLPRPQSLAADPESFAITVAGDSMWPRFRPGRIVAVSPRSAVSIRDDVLVRLKAGEGGNVLLKELVRRAGDCVELRQFNPDVVFSVETAEIEAIYKVAGEII
jgi:hypothetical protein